jgi:phospholipid-binding lipoprotein MlaA
MRHHQVFLIVFILISAGLATGCASQRKIAETQPPWASGNSPQVPLNASDNPPQEDSTASDSSPQETLTVTEELTPDLTDEEEALLEDEFEDWEDDQDVYKVSDPIEPFNRAMFAFNDTLYEWLLKPLSLGYRAIAPQPVRSGVSNFFHNLTAPIRFANCLLQGKGQAAAAEFASFTLNTIWGVLGFMDITKGYPELNPDPEDLGQTLGRYNIGNGFYIVWPFWGTSTLRDSVGRLGDAFLDPVSGYYLEPASTWIAIRGYNTVNELSFRIEDIDAAKKAAFDPYEAARDFYIQSRQTRIKK